MREEQWRLSLIIEHCIMGKAIEASPLARLHMLCLKGGERGRVVILAGTFTIFQLH
jgi:hypothetical protein